MKKQAALTIVALLIGCNPEEPADHGTSSGTEESSDVDTGTEEESSGDSTGDPADLPADDNWGIVLDVGPPYYSGTGESG